VDYGRRARLLEDLDASMANADRGGVVATLLGQRQATADATPPDAVTGDDRLKLFVAVTALRCRQRHRSLFADGDYTPLSVEGPRRDHVFAFLRSRGDEQALVAVPRLVATLTPDAALPVGERIWADTRIVLPRTAAAALHDIFLERCVELRSEGRASVPAADLFAGLPIACLETR
jgi:(1->4)-alpha-D-glucan 1-alpha-D-glucosylmutase